MDKAQNERTYNFVETLIFEPDNSVMDYILFSEIGTDGLLNLSIESNETSYYGFTYRVINEDTGEEISGNVNTNFKNRNIAINKNVTVDISKLSDGPLLIIAQIIDNNGTIKAVRSSRLTKGISTDIKKLESIPSLNVLGGKGDITIISTTSQEIIIYNVNGQVISRFPITEGTTRVNLKSGFYIVNNIKCIVK